MHGKPPPASASRAPDIDEFLSDLPPQRAVSRRLALWEIEGGMQCSIVGTCLSDTDLLAAMHKHKLHVERGAQSYDIHSYCVRAAGQNSPFSRSLTKLLDRRFAGALRLVGRAEREADVRVVWERLRDSGQIAAAYWAIMSDAHVPDQVKVGVFGEVHMLSHLNGRGANQLALKLAEAERKTADLEGRLKRAEQAKLEALAERDAARTALAAVPVRIPGATYEPAGKPDTRDDRLQQRLAKCTRALISARARARQAEEAAARLSERGTPLRRAPLAVERVAEPASPSPVAVPAVPKRILYLGGRAAVVPHLREVAEARAAAFLHHDGGIEDSLHRIEELIEHCDAVVCPIDCISHGACRMAKVACQRLNKRFLPIATASRSGFERALEQLARPTGARAAASGASTP